MGNIRSNATKTAIEVHHAEPTNVSTNLFSNFFQRRTKKVQNTNQAIFVGSEIRCPQNHKCFECVDNRKNNMNLVLEKKQLTCNTCSKSLNEIEGSFWSCLMCNFDVCSACVTRGKEKNIIIVEPIEFVDVAGVRIRLCVENNCVVQYRDEEKLNNVSHFTLNANGKYRDYQGTGEIAVDFDVRNLRKQIKQMFKVTRKNPEKNPEFLKSTFVHNPNWEFMLPTTLQQLIMSDKDFECPRIVADIIASFVVERTISIPMYQYDQDGLNSLFGEGSRFDIENLPDDFNGISPAFNKYITGPKRELVSMKAQLPISEIELVIVKHIQHGKYRIIDMYVVNLDNPKLLQSGGLPPTRELAEKYFQQLPQNDALVGDVFAWDSTALVVVREELRMAVETAVL